MTTETKTTGPEPTGKRRAGLCVLFVIAAAGGVYSGARWHTTLEPLLGQGTSASAHHEHADDGVAHELWTCSMHPQVKRDKPGLCPICHMQLTPLKVDPRMEPLDHTHDEMRTDGTELDPAATTMPGANSAANPGKDRKVKYWWDPMLSPPYIADRPGKSPMGMDLVPVYEDEAGSGGGGRGAVGQVVIDPAVVQNMGVRIALVTEGPLVRTVRAVGYIDEAQPNVREINLRVSGWIKHLYANTEGQHVKAGDPLFDLYSPELNLAIEELINGRRAMAALPTGADTSAKETATTLYSAVADKLEVLGLARAQIEAMAKLDKAPPFVTFASPVMGHITEKPVVEGAAVKAGDRVLRIVDHSTLWLDVQVFEKDLPFFKVGQQAVATIASRPDERITGTVIFIHPHVDMMTRAAVVRVAVPNPTLALKPGMYATVYAKSQVSDRAVMVPREAIIDTGDSQVVFVTRAVGRFEPRKVRMGLAGEDGMVQVIEGLTPGEAVVTSGQFLLDSESRLREAIQKYLNEKRPASRPSAAQSKDAAMDNRSSPARNGGEP